MLAVPRHEFVPADVQSHAYDDRPLPVGEGQTISQPYIVALMTQAAKLTPEAVVLEIGTGSGYAAAILSQIVKQVSSLSITSTPVHFVHSSPLMISFLCALVFGSKR